MQNKLFNQWLDTCPVNFTQIKVNGREAYLFGKNTDLIIECEMPEDNNRYYIAGAKVDSITFYSIADMKKINWEKFKNDQGGEDFFLSEYLWEDNDE